MPLLGEIKKGKDINKKPSTNKFIWQACPDCGKERWVCLKNGEPKSKRCVSCAKKKDPRRFSFQNNHWKGGRTISDEYVLIKLQLNDFFYLMADKRGYVKEHRLVVAKALGRCLQPWEIVHHKHTKYPAGSIEDKQDNRYPENLQLVTDDRHKQITILEEKIDRLIKGQKELKSEVRLLRWQLKEREHEDIK